MTGRDQTAPRLRSLSIAIAVGLSAAGIGLAQNVLDLNSVYDNAGFVVSSIETGDRLGTSVAAAGDVNGDGLADIIVGAYNAAPNGIGLAGSAYVIFGRTSQSNTEISVENLTGRNGFALNGFDEFDRAGFAVSAAGDINGDGLDDVIVGSPNAAPGGKSYAGQAFVVFGKNSAFPPSLDLSSLDGSNGFALNGADELDRSGRAVGRAGDINGDGIDDLVVGAPSAEPGGLFAAGECYVVFGRSEGFPAELELSRLDGSDGFTLSGFELGGSACQSVSTAGDVNSDNFDDLLIGSPGTESGGLVVFGFDNPSISQLSLGGLNGINGFSITDNASPGNLGQSVGASGDINGDGIADVVLGSPTASPAGRPGAGRSVVVFGHSSPFPANIDAAELDGSNGFIVEGIDSGESSGTAVRFSSDVNNDGVDDLLIGAPNAPVGESPLAGRTYVLFGRTVDFAPDLDLSALNGSNGFVIEGNQGSQKFGFAVAKAGDVNGDGIDDFLVGDRNDALQSGLAFVVFGNGTPLSRTSAVDLRRQTEDELESYGNALDFTLAAAFLDSDEFGGAAIISDASSAVQGRWQYKSIADGWVDLPDELSDESALVVRSTDLVRFVPAPDFFGQAGSLTARLWDGRWREPGENIDITSAIGAFGGFSTDPHLVDIRLEIQPVNDAPNFIATQPPEISEDDRGIILENWASFSAGPENEADQFALLYQVENISNPELFSVLPTIGTLGNLIYDPAPDANGVSSFDVRVIDSGGSDRGGDNASEFQNFTITVNPVNDSPLLIAVDPPPVTENGGPQIVRNWALAATGPIDESGQALTFAVTGVGDDSLFEALPTLDESGNLRYTPACDATGTSTFTVVVSDDGGRANGGQDQSAPVDFVIEIRPNLLFASGFE
ncbi:MAG: Ig-like domain-containing protein [Pseudomonadota bacterium]